MSKFPTCRHAATPIDTEVRRCHSPKLAGLKWVAPSTCEQCYCRDHEPESTTENEGLESVACERSLSCAYLGPSVNTAGNKDWSPEGSEETYLCKHPAHEETTLVRCQTCRDYLFPIITPRMPAAEVKLLIELPPLKQDDDWWTWENVWKAHRLAIDESIQNLTDPKDTGQGRGIVVVGGGKYFVSCYVTIRIIRHLGCQLPIELWHLSGEIDDELQSLLKPWNVICRDADALSAGKKYRFLKDHWWQGWQLKSFALRHCSFQEVLMLDSDSYPVRNPEFLFDWPRYREWGAILWPDLQQNVNLIPEGAWSIFGIPRWPELPTESGQMLINKKLCWREVNLALKYNAHADFVYQIVYGDKDTFPLAWHRLGRQYARMWPYSILDDVAIRQFDDAGQTLFLHRVHDKFRLTEVQFDGTPQRHVENAFRADFPLEETCFKILHELAKRDLKSPWLRNPQRNGKQHNPDSK